MDTPFIAGAVLSFFASFACVACFACVAWYAYVKVRSTFAARVRQETDKIFASAAATNATFDARVADVFVAHAPDAADAVRAWRLPDAPVSADALVHVVAGLRALDTHAGFVSGTEYFTPSPAPLPDDPLAAAAQLFGYTNQIHADLYPSLAYAERYILRAVAAQFDAPPACGFVSYGGSESVFCALHAFRERARARRPNVVCFDSVHCCVDKACHYLGVRLIKVPAAPRASRETDIARLAARVDRNTIGVVLSAPSYAFGTVDDWVAVDRALAARGRDIPIHVDACLGGFVLLFADTAFRRLFDTPRVQSVSMCLHKFGYTQKGVSMVMYRNKDYLLSQYTVATAWDGGLYVSPSVLGSRNGALLVQALAAVLSTGARAYADHAAAILDMASYMETQLLALTEVEVFERDAHVVAFRLRPPHDAQTYVLYDALVQRGFHLNALQSPPAIHCVITRKHDRAAVDRCVDAVREVAQRICAGHVDDVRPGIAPVYGNAARLGIVAGPVLDACLREYLYAQTHA